MGRGLAPSCYEVERTRRCMNGGPNHDGQDVYLLACICVLMQICGAEDRAAAIDDDEVKGMVMCIDTFGLPRQQPSTLAILQTLNNLCIAQSEAIAVSVASAMLIHLSKVFGTRCRPKGWRCDFRSLQPLVKRLLGGRYYDRPWISRISSRQEQRREMIPKKQ